MPLFAWGREVAIKISAERFSDRFDREVRAVAALNYANICHPRKIASHSSYIRMPRFCDKSIAVLDVLHFQCGRSHLQECCGDIEVDVCESD